MNAAAEQPDSIEGFQQVLKTARLDSRKVTIAGARSKLRVGEPDDRLVVSTIICSGIVDHQASDFTITVRAGTPVRDVIAVLENAGQFLPFDPVFAGRGATVGGMIAAGINGPCRMRFGGLRDFVIGCQFLDGMGNVIRAGGRVVKNAAGFDLPKFLVGSGGKFGLLLEATFKVFPRPLCNRTLLTGILSIDSAVGSLRQLLDTRIDLDALEILESGRVAVRLSGVNEAAVVPVCDHLLRRLDLQFEMLEGADEEQFWIDQSNFSAYGPAARIIKIPVIRDQICDLDREFRRLNIARRISAAGNVVMLFLPDDSAVSDVDLVLCQAGLTGQFVVGNPEQFLIGSSRPIPFLKRIQAALDPETIFGPIETESGVGVAP